jgi:hypothetical protein
MTLIAATYIQAAEPLISVEVYILCLVISDNPYTFLRKQNKGPFHLGHFSHRVSRYPLAMHGTLETLEQLLYN